MFTDSNEEYFILLVDLEGQVLPKNPLERHLQEFTRNYFSRKKIQTWHARQGSLFVKKEASQECNTDSEGLFFLHDNQHSVIFTKNSNLSILSQNRALMLMPISSEHSRYKTFQDTHKLEMAETVTLGCQVAVKGVALHESLGVLRFIGRLAKAEGIYFGVKFENAIGDCSGNPYFTANPNHATFATLDRITFNPPVMQKLHELLGFHIGDKVVLENRLSLNATPMVAVIRYLGRNSTECVVGIETDTELEVTNGNYYASEKLFDCMPRRGIIVDPTQLKPFKQSDAERIVKPSGQQLIDSKLRSEERHKIDLFIENIKKDINNVDTQCNMESLPANYMTSLDSTVQDTYYTTCPENSELWNDKDFDDESMYGEPKESEITFFKTTSNDTTSLSLQVGSMVEVCVNNQPLYGVIRWIGYHQSICGELAGLELENNTKGSGSGQFQGQRYFECQEGRAFFLKLSQCRPDSRFSGPGSPTEARYEVPVIAIKGCFPPIQQLELKIVGKKRGIQGHHNSCYMDATLFAMFAFSYVFDCALYRDKRKNDIPQFDEVQRCLREKIVNPLRLNGYVAYQSVMELRKSLNALAELGGYLNEEKDPEEFFSLLFDKVLNVDPYLAFTSNNGPPSGTHLYQIFTMMDHRNPQPSTQYLLEYSFLSIDLVLTEIPSVMVLQMPRLGTNKIYNRIQVCPTLDITKLLHNVEPQSCVICGQPTQSYCKDCACAFGWDSVYAYMCEKCYGRVHTHPDRVKHKPPVHRSGNRACMKPVLMELFAVVCIQTSHYVTFAKCSTKAGDNKWVFFDSMADRYGGTKGYNIPEVTECKDIEKYLCSTPVEIANITDKTAVRLFDDVSLCFYRQNQISAYK